MYNWRLNFYQLTDFISFLLLSRTRPNNRPDPPLPRDRYPTPRCCVRPNSESSSPQSHIHPLSLSHARSRSRARLNPSNDDIDSLWRPRSKPYWCVECISSFWLILNFLHGFLLKSPEFDFLLSILRWLGPIHIRIGRVFEPCLELFLFWIFKTTSSGKSSGW